MFNAFKNLIDFVAEMLFAFVMLPYAVPATLVVVALTFIAICHRSDKRNGFLNTEN